MRPNNPFGRTDATTIEELLVERVGQVVTAAIERAEARGEERARSLKTHLSPPEAAAALGISETHARAYIANGTIPSARLGGRIVVPRIALERIGMPS